MVSTVEVRQISRQCIRRSYTMSPLFSHSESCHLLRSRYHSSFFIRRLACLVLLQLGAGLLVILIDLSRRGRNSLASSKSFFLFVSEFLILASRMPRTSFFASSLTLWVGVDSEIFNELFFNSLLSRSLDCSIFFLRFLYCDRTN